MVTARFSRSFILFGYARMLADRLKLSVSNLMFCFCGDPDECQFDGDVCIHHVLTKAFIVAHS